MDIDTCEGVGGALYTAMIETADWREIPSSARMVGVSFNDVTNWFFFSLFLYGVFLHRSQMGASED